MKYCRRTRLNIDARAVWRLTNERLLGVEVQMHIYHSRHRHLSNQHSAGSSYQDYREVLVLSRTDFSDYRKISRPFYPILPLLRGRTFEPFMKVSLHAPTHLPVSQ